MKVTVEMSDAEMKEIQRVTNEKRKGPAIRKLAIDALKLRKRKEMSARIVAGELAVELPELDELRRDRRP